MFYSCQKYITSHDEDSSGKPNLRDILQNNWPVLFQNVDVMKDKERLGAVPGLRRRTTTCSIFIGSWIGAQGEGLKGNIGQISEVWIRMVFKSVPSTRLSFASWKQLSYYSSGFLAFSNTWCKPNTWGCLMNECILYFKQQAFLLGLLFHVLVWIFHWDKSPHQKTNLYVCVCMREIHICTHTHREQTLSRNRFG